MNRLIWVLMLILIVSGCANKKVISSFNKGAEIIVERQEVKEKSHEKEVVVEKRDKIREGENRMDVETVVEYIFGNSGALERITKKVTDRSVMRDKTIDTGHSVTENEKVAEKSATSVKTVDRKEVVKDKDVEKKGKNPIWYWIGAGLFICIIGVVFYYVVWKK